MFFLPVSCATGNQIQGHVHVMMHSTTKLRSPQSLLTKLDELGTRQCAFIPSVLSPFTIAGVSMAIYSRYTSVGVGNSCG